MFKIKKYDGSFFKNFFNEHANFITILVAVVIFIGGLGVVKGESKLWLTALSVVILLIALFIFKNARVVIKAGITILVSFFSAFIALQANEIVETLKGYGLVWMTSQVFLFTLCIFTSYMFLGFQSRWTSTTIGILTSFITVSVLADSINPGVAILVGVILGVFAFIAFYRLKGHWFSKKSKMPEILLDYSHIKTLEEIAKENNWNFRTLSVPLQKTPSVIVWNEEKSFALIPVKLNQKLGITGSKKRTSIAYQSNSINNWVKGVYFRFVPQWRSKFADTMVVLLDVKAANGFEAKTIGLSVPDSSSKIAVGLYPAKNMFTEDRRTDGVLDSISEKYGKFTSDLTESQRKALEDIASSSDYI